MHGTRLRANASEGSRARRTRRVFSRRLPRFAGESRSRLPRANAVDAPAAGHLPRRCRRRPRCAPAWSRAAPADGRSWPWVTFAVNIAGTTLLAYVVTRLSHRPHASPLLGIGLRHADDVLVPSSSRHSSSPTTTTRSSERPTPSRASGPGYSLPMPWQTRPLGAWPQVGAWRSGGVTAAVWSAWGVVSGVGAVLRFLLHGAVQRRAASEFPFGTLAVNLLGRSCSGSCMARASPGTPCCYGHGPARLVHDVLGLDGRDRRPARAPRGRSRRRQRARQPRSASRPSPSAGRLARPS